MSDEKFKKKTIPGLRKTKKNHRAHCKKRHFEETLYEINGLFHVFEKGTFKIFSKKRPFICNCFSFSEKCNSNEEGERQQKKHNCSSCLWREKLSMPLAQRKYIKYSQNMLNVKGFNIYWASLQCTKKCFTWLKQWK